MEAKQAESVFSFLAEQNRRPPLFSVHTAEELWTDPHIAEQMLSFHLDPDQDLASRNHAFIQESIRWLNGRFDLAAGKRVLDLGCGPGLYANGLAALGASVTGVDFSGNSIRHARSVASASKLGVDYLQADYLELRLAETFDLILLIFGDFCALGPDRRRRLLDNARKWLSPGGRFVFDVSSAALFERIQESVSYEAAPEGGFWSAEPHFSFTHRFKYEADMAYLDRYAVIEENRHREVFNWIQCYDRSSLESELRDAEWIAEETFGDVAGGILDPDADFFAVVARPADPGVSKRS
jgi:SAM-dependent methyltransferase